MGEKRFQQVCLCCSALCAFFFSTWAFYWYLLQSASIMLGSRRKTERYTDIQTDKMTGGRTEWLTERDGWGKQSQARNGVFSVHWPARTGDLLVLYIIDKHSQLSVLERDTLGCLHRWPPADTDSYKDECVNLERDMIVCAMMIRYYLGWFGPWWWGKNRLFTNCNERLWHRHTCQIRKDCNL